jgi:hypothetical protein
MNAHFSIKKALYFSFQKFGAYSTYFLTFALLFSLFYLGLFVIFGIITALLGISTPSFAENFFINPQAPLWFTFIVLGFHALLFIFEEFYYYKILLTGYRLADNFDPEALNFSTQGFFPFFLARWSYYLKVFLGLVLLIVPGIYFAIKYYFAGFPLAQKTASTIGDDAHKTAVITDGARMKLFWFSLIVTGLGLIIAFVLLPLLINPLTSYLTETTRMIINLSIWHILATFLSPIKQLMEVSIYKQLKEVSSQP